MTDKAIVWHRIIEMLKPISDGSPVTSLISTLNIRINVGSVFDHSSVFKSVKCGEIKRLMQTRSNLEGKTSIFRFFVEDKDDCVCEDELIATFIFYPKPLETEKEDLEILLDKVNNEKWWSAFYSKDFERSLRSFYYLGVVEVESFLGGFRAFFTQRHERSKDDVIKAFKDTWLGSPGYTCQNIARLMKCDLSIELVFPICGIEKMIFYK